MKRSILFMAALLGIAACARGPSLQSRMATFIGSSGENLVQNLGVPDKEITLNGFQYLAYIRQQTTITPSAPLFIGYGGFGPYGGPWGGPWGGPFGGYYGGAFPPSVNVWRCETTFMLQHDRVLSFSMRGNDCS
jgi:hypothetical protein